jgi:hypothetical protein
MADNANVCDIAELEEQMNAAKRNDLPDLFGTVQRTRRCLKSKLRIYRSPRNGRYILLAAAATP